MYQPSQNLLTPRSSEQSISIQIIPNQLYWVSSKDIPNKEADSIFIFADQSHKYQPFNYDFGPLHLGEVYKFVTKLQSALRICKKSNTKICVFTSNDPQKQANSIFLVCSYMVVSLGIEPEKALYFFKEITHIIPPYRDCTADPFSPYKCYIVECLKGLNFAHDKNWFDFNKFDLQEYDYISQKGNGDYNDIVPGKMIAFSGPLAQRPPGSYGQVYTPQDYVPLFKKLGVTLVVRLNEKKYDENIFKQNGIDHIDLIFDDGSTPPQHIVETFLSASEKTPGKVAVHCKSGFGRTGTLIGMYAMKHFKIPAKDFIGWMRIARPGSIHGPQHEYLVDHQEEMFAQSTLYSSPIKTQKKNYGRTQETATPIKNDYNSNSGAKDPISNKLQQQFSNMKVTEFSSGSVQCSPLKQYGNNKYDELQNYRKQLFSDNKQQKPQVNNYFDMQAKQQEQPNNQSRHQRYNSSIENSYIYRKLQQQRNSNDQYQHIKQEETSPVKVSEKFLQQRREQYELVKQNQQKQYTMNNDSTCSSTNGQSQGSISENPSSLSQNMINSNLSNYEHYQKQSIVPNDIKNKFNYNNNTYQQQLSKQQDIQQQQVCQKPQFQSQYMQEKYGNSRIRRQLSLIDQNNNYPQQNSMSFKKQGSLKI